MTATNSDGADAKFASAVRRLARTLAASLTVDTGFRADPVYLAAIDDGLDQLIPVAQEMTADVGADMARGLLMQMFEVEPEKTAALFSAALVRLGDVT